MVDGDSSMTTFNYSDRVYYTSGKHGAASNNPLVGTKYECAGTIYEVDNQHHIRVEWDNGRRNSYDHHDLIHATDSSLGKQNPNLTFRMKKLGLRPGRR